MDTKKDKRLKLKAKSAIRQLAEAAKKGGKMIVKKNLKAKRTLCEIYSRIVGYLRPVNQWNPGKEAEFSKRKTYKIN